MEKPSLQVHKYVPFKFVQSELSGQIFAKVLHSSTSTEQSVPFQPALQVQMPDTLPQVFVFSGLHIHFSEHSFP